MRLLLGLLLVSAAAVRATIPNNGQNYVNNQEYVNRQQGYSVSDGQGRTYEYSQTRTKDTGNGIDITREDRKYTDNSINRNGADFSGASNFQIGHQRGAEQIGKNQQRRQQQVVDIPTNNGQMTDGSRGQRVDYNGQRTDSTTALSVGGNGHRTDLRVHSTSSQYENNAINTQNANFQSASNFQIGHQRGAEQIGVNGQRGQQQVADVPTNNGHMSDGTDGQRVDYNGQRTDLRVRSRSSQYENNAINMQNANFQGASNFQIGHRGKISTGQERPVRGKRAAREHGHRNDSYNLQNSNFKNAHHFTIDSGRTRAFDPKDRPVNLQSADYSGQSHFTIKRERTRLFPKNN